MVDIREFFGSNSAPKKNGSTSRKSGRSTKASSSSAKNSSSNPIELADLDDDDFDQFVENKALKKDDQSLEVLDSQPTSKERGSSPAKRPSSNTKKELPVKKRKIVPSNTNTAQELLATIPSVDLSQVHVKENISFNFNNKQQEVDVTDSDSSVFPEGKPNCLLGLTIVFTGVLPTLERGIAESIAKKYGARVTKSISSKTSLVVLGDEAGPKKVQKIKELSVKVIDEDGFRQLVSGMPAEGGDGDAAEKARTKLKEQEEQAQKDAEEMIKKEEEERVDRERKLKQAASTGNSPRASEMIRDQDKLWTVKYAPTNLQQICGNKSSVNKLKNWLSNWQVCHKQGFKQSGRDGLGIYRAAMIYGPPGIGKTTAAHLVAKELGYDILEQNASDVRSKSLLNAGVKNALDNTSVVGFFKQKKNGDANAKNFVIIMDEVDGMSGGDRGGVGQMAAFCRKTSTPMILICNERNLPKMRPFDRVCLDIPFRRPDANSIKARLMTIAVREGFKLDPTIVDKLVEATRGDIRQIVNLLSTVSKTTKTIGHENAQQIAQAWEKNIALKPFDIAHKMFDGRHYTDIGAKRFPLYKKMELYFDDFDFAPLMIQENYLNTRPSVLKQGQSHLAAVAEAADYISQGDLIERKIRSSEQLWSLLPFHAVMSSVSPASKVAGQMAGRINFTTWLGQNSKMGKYYRLLQELQYHTKVSTSTNKLGLRMDYMPTFKQRLLKPLLDDGSDGIPKVIEIMDQYYLSKEDWDAIMEFMIGPDKTDTILKKIPATVKSAFTRKYNNMTHPVAIYRTGSTTALGGKVSTSKPDFEDVVDADDDVPPADDEEKNDENDFKKDKLIKQGKPKGAKKKGSTAKKRAT